MKLGYVISFMVGGALSTSLTLYFSKRYYDKKHTIELAACKEYYDEKVRQLDADTKKEEHNSETNTVSATDDDSAIDINATPIGNDNSVKEAITEEEKIIQDAADYLERAGLAKEEKPSKRSKKAKKEKPYLITPEAFNGDDDVMYRDEYKHITLDYYEGDDMVCESSTNEVFANTGRWLGYVWKNHFGDEEYEYGPNEVYIRNDELKVDYEVVRDPGYYSEQVLGIVPDYENGEGDRL